LNSNSNLSDSPGSSPLLGLQAHGNLHVGRFALKKLFATQLATRVDLDRGKITLTALRAQLLQGTHLGNWTIEASAPDAQSMHYQGSGVVQNISLEQVGALMNDAWIAGTADGNFDLEGSGGSLREVLTRSDGHLQFVMRNGTLSHIEIPESPMPLPVHRFSGDLRLTKGAWELSAGSLESHDGIYQVSGTASRLNGIDFVLTRGDEQSWTVTGTLSKPRVVPVSRTEARRTEAEPKPEPKTVKP
jgi:AsmA protein